MPKPAAYRPLVSFEPYFVLIYSFAYKSYRMDRAWGPQMNGAIRRMRAHIRLLKKPETIRSKIGANQREQHQNSALLNDKETLPIWAGEKISFDNDVV